MGVTLTYASTATITETLDANTESASDENRKIIHSAFNESGILSAASTPPVTKAACFVQALTAGTATIDLTALTGTNGASVDGTTLKVQYFRMKNLGANPMSITFGGSDPYNLAGADFKMTLEQNQNFEHFGNNATPDIAAGAKNLDLAGTTTQTCEITIVMG